jgi:YgiT-type zinc finger domain-containing protein
MAQATGSFTVSACPSCGSAGVREVVGVWSGRFKGKPYTVRGLRYFDCPQCGENVYDPKSMRMIEAASPAYAGCRRRRGAA